MSSPVNGVPASNSDDDMRRDLQNIQMQSNQVTDEVRVHSWNKNEEFWNSASRKRSGLSVIAKKNMFWTFRKEIFRFYIAPVLRAFISILDQNNITWHIYWKTICIAWWSPKIFLSGDL